MKYWGRCLLVYVTITAVLYGTNSVAGGRSPPVRFTGGGRLRGSEVTAGGVEEISVPGGSGVGELREKHGLLY